MSAPGRAVKRADRRDGLADEEEEAAVDEEAGDENGDDEAKVCRASRAAPAQMRERAFVMVAARAADLVIDVSVDEDMLYDVTRDM